MAKSKSGRKNILVSIFGHHLAIINEICSSQVISVVAAIRQCIELAGTLRQKIKEGWTITLTRKTPDPATGKTTMGLIVFPLLTLETDATSATTSKE